MPRILHLLDPTTSADAVESLALLLSADESQFPGEHQLAIFGHRSTARLLAYAGLADPPPPIRWLPSMGWADPSGWRALRRLIREDRPTHLHAWGVPSAVAAAVARSSAQQIVTLAQLPHTAPWMILRALDTGDWRSDAAADPGHILWTTAAQSIARPLRARLRQHEANPDSAARRVLHIPPAVTFPPAPVTDLAAVREELDLPLDLHPVILLAGDASGRSRHDFGLWVGGILQTIFPNVRVIVREDPRGRRDTGMERLLNNLSDGNIPILAPAEFSWDQLLALSDLVLVSADGSVEIAAVLHAMAAGVPVVGTPVDAVREIIQHNHNGLIATECKPRAITAQVEALLSNPDLKTRLTQQAALDVATRHSPNTLITAYQQLYETTAPVY